MSSDIVPSVHTDTDVSIAAIVPESAVPALPDGWIDQAIPAIYNEDDIGVLVGTRRDLAALKQWVQRKKDKDNVSLAEIETRAHIGDLLGPNPGKGPGRGKTSDASDLLKSDERYEFRLMSQHRPIYRALTDKGERAYRNLIAAIKQHRRQQGLDEAPDPVEIPGVHIPDTPTAVKDLRVDAGTVDLIFTDPPYGVEALDVWDDLATFANHALKPGGLLVTYSGQMFLPEAIWALNSELEYVWVGAIVHDGAFFQLRQHKIQVGWKPLLVYGKPPVKIERWWNDTLTDGRREKDYHGWQQSVAEAANIIDAFTVPGDHVVDPFLGGGTTAVAAIKMQRQFSGCDIDPEAIYKTNERLRSLKID